MNRLPAVLYTGLALASLAACGTSNDSQPVGADKPTVVASTAAPDDEAATELQDIGDKVTVTNPDGSPLLEISLDRFVDTSCDQPASAPTAVNGRFTAAQLTVHTFDDPQNRLPGINLTQGWSYLAAEGARPLPASTPAAAACHHETLALSAQHSYSAAVVLDVPPDASDDRATLDVADTHWEWPVGN